MANDNAVIDNQSNHFQWGPEIDQLLQMVDPANPHNVYSFVSLSIGSIKEMAKV